MELVQEGAASLYRAMEKDPHKAAQTFETLHISAQFLPKKSV